MNRKIIIDVNKDMSLCNNHFIAAALDLLLSHLRTLTSLFLSNVERLLILDFLSFLDN